MFRIEADLSQISLIVKKAVEEALTNFDKINPPPQIPEKKYLNLKETSEFLNLSRHTVYGLTSSGKLQHCGKTRKLIFDKNTLIEWLKNKN